MGTVSKLLTCIVYGDKPARAVGRGDDQAVLLLDIKLLDINIATGGLPVDPSLRLP